MMSKKIAASSKVRECFEDRKDSRLLNARPNSGLVVFQKAHSDANFLEIILRFQIMESWR